MVRGDDLRNIEGRSGGEGRGRESETRPKVTTMGRRGTEETKRGEGMESCAWWTGRRGHMAGMEAAARYGLILSQNNQGK